LDTPAFGLQIPERNVGRGETETVDLRARLAVASKLAALAVRERLEAGDRHARWRASKLITDELHVGHMARSGVLVAAELEWLHEEHAPRLTVHEWRRESHGIRPVADRFLELCRRCGREERHRAQFDPACRVDHIAHNGPRFHSAAGCRARIDDVSPSANPDLHGARFGRDQNLSDPLESR
jgi:hypothetical protein